MPFVLFNKPYQVLSQFRDADGRDVLANYIELANVYPVGRLDYTSEGLLLLTDDGRLQSRIAEPRFKLTKRYWVQVDGAVTDDAVSRLLAGTSLKDGPAVASHAAIIDEPPNLWQRQPPIRVRREIPTSWLDIGITEGRNRQVRRMTASVGFPTLRLVRHQVGPWHLGNLAPGRHEVISNEEAWQQLHREEARRK